MRPILLVLAALLPQIYGAKLEARAGVTPACPTSTVTSTSTIRTTLTATTTSVVKSTSTVKTTSTAMTTVTRTVTSTATATTIATRTTVSTVKSTITNTVNTTRTIPVTQTIRITSTATVTVTKTVQRTQYTTVTSTISTTTTYSTTSTEYSTSVILSTSVIYEPSMPSDCGPPTATTTTTTTTTEPPPSGPTCVNEIPAPCVELQTVTGNIFSGLLTLSCRNAIQALPVDSSIIPYAVLCIYQFGANALGSDVYGCVRDTLLCPISEPTTTTTTTTVTGLPPSEPTCVDQLPAHCLMLPNPSSTFNDDENTVTCANEIYLLYVSESAISNGLACLDRFGDGTVPGNIKACLTDALICPGTTTSTTPPITTITSSTTTTSTTTTTTTTSTTSKTTTSTTPTTLTTTTSTITQPPSSPPTTTSTIGPCLGGAQFASTVTATRGSSPRYYGVCNDSDISGSPYDSPDVDNVQSCQVACASSTCDAAVYLPPYACDLYHKPLTLGSTQGWSLLIPLPTAAPRAV